MSLVILVGSLSGLLPSRNVPHDHLLLGHVTPEQLRAHEAAEAAEATMSDDGLTRSSLVQTLSDGVIISISQASGYLVSVSVLQAALLLSGLHLVLDGVQIVRLAPALARWVPFPPLKPPPRIATR